MDIVERLRRYRPTYGWPEESSVIVEPTMNHVAADEIERLREALRLMPKTITEAADEIERLREALLHIAWGGIQSVDDAEKYARKALGEKE